MSEETDADIVVQLDALSAYAERANHWTDDMRLMDAAGVADTVIGAIVRIEELEAKLAKAVEALKGAAKQHRIIAGMDLMGASAAAYNAARAAESTIEELKGEKDE
jgi:hypothetical protein